MNAIYNSALQHLCRLQQDIQDVHPLLQTVFPLVIAEDDQFLIYVPISPTGPYRFDRQMAVPVPVPPGVRAAFPLEALDNRMACVVTADAFDSPEGYITIFHEFVHCQQFERWEQPLKNRLAIARAALAAGDFLWELNHPFPYGAGDFVQAYERILKAQAALDLPAVLEARRVLKALLRPQDEEYMRWQEWKEGFARLIENRLRRRLGQPENCNGCEPPFSRGSFYAGGAGLIEALAGDQPHLLLNLADLFDRMAEM